MTSVTVPAAVARMTCVLPSLACSRVSQLQSQSHAVMAASHTASFSHLTSHTAPAPDCGSVHSNLSPFSVSAASVIGAPPTATQLHTNAHRPETGG